MEHQIWLLRNVFCWYLLPFAIPILAFFAHVAWSLRFAGWLEALIFFVILAGSLSAIDVLIYYINQRAVRVGHGTAWAKAAHAACQSRR